MSGFHLKWNQTTVVSLDWLSKEKGCTYTQNSSPLYRGVKLPVHVNILLFYVCLNGALHKHSEMLN